MEENKITEVLQCIATNLAEMNSTLVSINEKLSSMHESVKDNNVKDLLDEIKDHTEELNLLSDIDTNTEHSDVTELIEQILEAM